MRTQAGSKESTAHAAPPFFAAQSSAAPAFFAPIVQAKCTACEEVQKLQRWEDRKEESIRPAPLQPKLTIGKPGDRYEQEADSMADAVMRTSEPGALANGPHTIEVQRMPISPISAGLLQRDAAESCNLKDEPVEEWEEENEETEDVEAIPAAEKPVSPKREAGEVSRRQPPGAFGVFGTCSVPRRRLPVPSSSSLC